MTSISLVYTLLYLGTAVVLRAAVGFDRQWRQRLAGLRINTLY